MITVQRKVEALSPLLQLQSLSGLFHRNTGPVTRLASESEAAANQLLAIASGNKFCCCSHATSHRTKRFSHESDQDVRTDQ